MPFVEPFKHARPVWQNNVYIEDFSPTTQWVVLEEELERQHDQLVLVDLKNTTFGKVLKAGPEAQALGVREGDRVVYEEWQGGRWVFGSRSGAQRPVLIVSVDFLSVVLRDDSSL